MKIGVVVFPGSNCDRDCFFAGALAGHEMRFLWHQERDLHNVDCVILPGGFSYGDYLRAGAIARFSPIIEEVIAHARRGGLVLGICNGFQVLLEAGLLPGAMLPNKSLKFVSKPVHLRVENTSTPFTRLFDRGTVIRLPIAHGLGNFYADKDTLDRLEGEGRVVFRYCDRNGNPDEAHNPNGSLNNIAGICNEEGNVLGMMPHPERASEEILGGTDGLVIFRSLLS
ncbi:MAG TPA: phosphoribosylformylglycinamidine synthase subunit PurQ [Firmicutes bacterium]|nr:phosphoribosylformylglycinamidine synthase subunit PurQ [Bacillota bacterium]